MRDVNAVQAAVDDQFPVFVMLVLLTLWMLPVDLGELLGMVTRAAPSSLSIWTNAASFHRQHADMQLQSLLPVEDARLL